VLTAGSNELESDGVPGATSENLPAGLPDIVSPTDYFDPFGGHAFLYFFQLVELLFGWMRPQPAAMRGRRASASRLNLSSAALKQWGACSLGTLCCIVAAAGLIPIFSASSAKSLLPLPFLLIIVLVALFFGRTAGVLGTAIAAFLFANYLFEPTGMAVSDPVARAHLIWMVILGVVISDLLPRVREYRIQSGKPEQVRISRPQRGSARRL
jgi:hypothetical protein